MAALSGEKESHLTGIRRLLPYVHPRARSEGPGPLQPVRQLVHVAGHDRESIVGKGGLGNLIAPAVNSSF
ncbi:hypothetical protein ABZY44_33835, partial [Streptomyces sp. NPDC006544]|uniref:hypothetical protein n=1 Tax=Streptomyces sp. NPDC006544 TaxID=3154583 RepID=UPI0033A64CE2